MNVNTHPPEGITAGSSEQQKDHTMPTIRRINLYILPPQGAQVGVAHSTASFTMTMSTSLHREKSHFIHIV